MESTFGLQFILFFYTFYLVTAFNVLKRESVRRKMLIFISTKKQSKISLSSIKKMHNAVAIQNKLLVIANGFMLETPPQKKSFNSVYCRLNNLLLFVEVYHSKRYPFLL